jgi:hypothetical protein
VAVRDSGIGIDEESAKRLFQCFRQACLQALARLCAYI